ncbi:MAG: AtpZ/AtpI family protein [Pseudomonadota bacterium]
MGERTPAGTTRLRELDARIRAARSPEPSPTRNQKHKFTLVSMAWRMVFEMAAGMAVGAAMGWGLDSLFGTLPFFLILFWLLGFAAGIRMVMQSANELQKHQADAAAAANQSAPEGAGRKR